MSGKRKHIPKRTCIGCRKVLSKRSMTRIVRTSDGSVQIDHSGKLPGRGAYLHNQHACWENGIKNSIAHALKITLSPQDKEKLIEFLNTLPIDTPEET